MTSDPPLLFVPVGANEARPFGMGSRERACRLATNAGLECAEQPEPGRAMLLASMRYAWDPAWLKLMRDRPGAMLTLGDEPVMVHVPVNGNLAAAAATLDGAAFDAERDDLHAAALRGDDGIGQARGLAGPDAEQDTLAGAGEDLFRSRDDVLVPLDVPDVRRRPLASEVIERVLRRAQVALHGLRDAAEHLARLAGVVLHAGAGLDADGGAALLEAVDDGVDVRARDAGFLGELVSGERAALDERHVGAGLVLAESDGLEVLDCLSSLCHYYASLLFGGGGRNGLFLDPQMATDGHRWVGLIRR